MGILDVVLGRDANGQPSKINMAMMALMAWQLYKSMQGSGGAQASPAPSPSPMPRQAPTREARLPQQEPQTQTRTGGDDEFGELLDSMTRGNATRPTQGDVAGGGGGLGGGLGDILGDILGGGRGMPGGGRPDPRGGGGMGGGLGDILGDLLGGGRGMPRAGVQGQGGGSANPLGDLLGGLLTGGAAGGGQMGGLGALLQQFDQAGKGQAAQSWVGTGANEQLSPREIEDTFGSNIIDTLAQRFGMPKDELLRGLSEEMPKTIDQLTPQGQLPSREDVERWV